MLCSGQVPTARHTKHVINRTPDISSDRRNISNKEQQQSSQHSVREAKSTCAATSEINIWSYSTRRAAHQPQGAARLRCWKTKPIVSFSWVLAPRTVGWLKIPNLRKSQQNHGLGAAERQSVPRTGICHGKGAPHAQSTPAATVHDRRARGDGDIGPSTGRLVERVPWLAGHG